MKAPCKKPCKACPFRRQSLPGWLGAASTEQFAQTVMADMPMPCHSTVDYDDPDWREGLHKARYCRGALTLFANQCKLSRDPERPRVPADREEVFGHIGEFVEHHNSLIEGGSGGALNRRERDS